jgi:hypothetical protein
MTFDKTNLRKLSADIQSALDAVGKQHGITIVLGGGRFSPTEYRAKVTASTTAPANAVDRARKEFDEHCGAFFLRSGDFGASFTNPYGGGTFTVCGIKPRSFKHPILCRNSRGTVYKIPASQVLRGLGRTDEARKQSDIEMRGTEMDIEVRAARRGLV